MGVDGSGWEWVGARFSITHIIAINDIAKEIFESTESPYYHDINCLIYATTMTCKEYIQDIQQKKNTLSKWLHHLEQSINTARKELNHIILLIKYKKENSYSKHQKKLLNKYRKKLGNTTLRLFECKSTILKQELKSKSEKLKYQKKQESTLYFKQILRKFFDRSKKIQLHLKRCHLKEMFKHFGKAFGSRVLRSIMKKLYGLNNSRKNIVTT